MLCASRDQGGGGNPRPGHRGARRHGRARRPRGEPGRCRAGRQHGGRHRQRAFHNHPDSRYDENGRNGFGAARHRSSFNPNPDQEPTRAGADAGRNENTHCCGQHAGAARTNSAAAGGGPGRRASRTADGERAAGERGDAAAADSRADRGLCGAEQTERRKPAGSLPGGHQPGLSERGRHPISEQPGRAVCRDCRPGRPSGAARVD